MSVVVGPLLLASLLAAEPPVSGARAAREAEEILAQERYLFCADAGGYLPSPNDDRWCEVAELPGAGRAACPGYAALCEDRAGGQGSYVRPEGSGQENSGPEGEGQVNPGAGQEPQRVSMSEGEEESSVSTLARVLIWILLIGIALGVVVAVARNLVRGRRDDGDADELDLPMAEDPGSSLVAAQVAARRVVETDVRRLLARAEDAAARGAHDDAIHNVYAALLRRLEGDALIRVDRWKTNGDYLRALSGPLRDEVRPILREVEQVQFGAAPAEAGRYASIRAKVLAIVKRASLAALVALGLGTQPACDELEDDPVATPTTNLAGLGTGPTDQRAVAELLAGFGIEARHRSQTIEQLAQTEGAIVLLEDVELSESDWDQLIAWVEDHGGVLIIASGQEFPRRLAIDYMSGPQEVLELRPGTGEHVRELELLAPAGRTLSPRSVALVESEAIVLRPWRDPENAGLEDPADPEFDPYVLSRRLGEGRIVVFAEPALFDNAALLFADNAALLVNLLRSLEIDELEFVNSRTGAGADNPLESVREAKLGALFIQLLVFLALLYAAVGVPFARLRDPPARRRRAFAEHAQTLGQRYAQARAAHFVAAHYCGWVLERLRERFALSGKGGGAGRGLLPLAQAIASRTGRSEAEVMRVLVEAHELCSEGPDIGDARGGPAELALMRHLATLHADCTQAPPAERPPPESP